MLRGFAGHGRPPGPAGCQAKTAQRPGPVRRRVRRRPRPAGRQLPAGIHPSRPDQRGQGPQRRAHRDPIHPTDTIAAAAVATPQASPGDAEATIAACPASSCLVTVAGVLLPANDTPGGNRGHSDHARPPGTHPVPPIARLARPRHAACHHRARRRADRRCCSPAVRDLSAGTYRRLGRRRAHLPPDHLADHCPSRQLTRAAVRRPGRPNRRQRQDAAGRGRRRQPPGGGLRPSPGQPGEWRTAGATDRRRRADRRAVVDAD
jgi:hypothetical protein